MKRTEETKKVLPQFIVTPQYVYGPEFTTVKRAVIYARVSTDEQAENGTSLNNQVEKSLAYAQHYSQANSVQVQIVGIFREDYTGKVLERPDLSQVLAMFRTKQAEMLIAFKNDRLDRSEWGLNLLLLLRELKTLEIELHYSEQGRQVDLNNPKEMLLESIGGWQSGDERNTIMKRLMDGKLKRVKEGSTLVCQNPPYGYSLEKNGKIFSLVIDEYEASIVRLIYRLYLHGHKGITMSLGDITRRLAEMGVPTYLDSGKRKRGFRKKRDINQWDRTTIRHILSNETYTGTWYYNKWDRINGKKRKLKPREEWIGVEIPAIVDKASFEAAKKQLTANKRNFTGRATKYKYLMNRRLRCHCGYKIRTMPVKGKNFYYTCPVSKDRSYPADCSLPNFPVPLVDEAIWNWVKQILEDDDYADQGIKRLQERQKSEIAPIEQALKIIEAEIADKERELNQAQETYRELKKSKAERTKAAVLTDIERIEIMLDGLEAQRAEAQAKLNAAKMSEVDILAVRERVKLLKQEAKEGLNIADASFEERKWFIERLNVEAILFVEEDGTKVLEARCWFGDKRIKLSNYS